MWVHAGISVHMARASTFWGLFSSPDAPADHPWKGYSEQTESSLDFTLRNVQRRGSSNHTVFSLAFTWVSGDSLSVQHALTASCRSTMQAPLACTWHAQHSGSGPCKPSSQCPAGRAAPEG